MVKQEVVAELVAARLLVEEVELAGI